jgi:uracil-DNA glycosylase
MQLKDIVGDWDRILLPILQVPNVINNLNKVYNRYREVRVYPKKEDVFKAFKLCPYNKLAVIILLQDPYHDGSATGISLANNKEGGKISPSLRVVRDCISRTVYKGQDFDFDPTLEAWEKQGVLMLNTALTVEEGKPLSHYDYWDEFTRKLLVKLSEDNSGITYCLWGKNAANYEYFINKDSNTVLKAYHPVYSVYTGKVWECNHFVDINNRLKAFNNTSINW